VVDVALANGGGMALSGPLLDLEVWKQWCDVSFTT